MLFKGRLASMSLRQAYMLHVNVTRMCDPKGPEAAKFPFNSQLSMYVKKQCPSIAKVYLLPVRFETPPFFPPSCFLSITPPSSFPLLPFHHSSILHSYLISFLPSSLSLFPLSSVLFSDYS